MEGNDGVSTTVFPSGEADISNDANQTPTGHQYTKTLTPNLVQFSQENFIVGHIAKLTRNVRIFFENPIGRRSNHEMDAVIFECGCASSVAMQYCMISWKTPNRLFYSDG